MDVLLQHQQSLIRVIRNADSSTKVKEFFDEIVLFLNNTTNNEADGFYIITIICQELSRFSNLKCFNHPEIINHPFFVILSRTFRMFLTKVTFTTLTKQDEECFYGISLLIRNLCLNNNKISTCFYTDNNEKLNPNNKEKFNVISYEKIFFTKLFIQKFVRIITDDIVINDYEPFHIKYKIIDCLIRLFMKLNDINHNLILDSIIKCLKSVLYRSVYMSIDLRQLILSPKQSFFLYQCPKFIRLCSYERQKAVSESLCEPILEYRVDIFEKHLPIALEGQWIPPKNYTDEPTYWNRENREPQGAKIQALVWYIELLNHFALTPETRWLFLKKLGINKSIVDQMIEILEAESLINSVLGNFELFHADVGLVSYAITLLYNLTFEKKIFYHLKDKEVIGVCENLYGAKDKTIEFASRTLGAILNQEEIDEIDSPTRVARSFLFLIENTIDDVTLIYHGIKLDGVLSNLETIVQNDNIKEEITNDDEGIPLIARCAYEPNLDEETIRRPALAIIDAISFANDSATKQIKENDLLMAHIDDLSKKNDKYQAKTANRILWKVEKESDFISKQETQKIRKKSTFIKPSFDEKKAIYQYIRGDHRFKLTGYENLEKFDIMISYCPDDKEICQKIYNRLIASDDYRISFDIDDTHSSKPEAMAKAIEGSTIVIICFSAKYRKSYACRLEAEYASKRDRPIIPIKIDPQYEPTGWLEEIIDKENYIDFAKSEPNTAYAQLIDKINEAYEIINNN